MKKILSFLITVLFVVSTCNYIVPANDTPTSRVNAIASDTFIELYTHVFERNRTYDVYDSKDNCITDVFILDNYQLFLDKNYDQIARKVAENGYVLQYGEPEIIPGEGLRAATTIYSAWKYCLSPLNDLVQGKVLEYSFRVKGSYTASGTQILSYQLIRVEYSITYPGDMFPYTVYWVDTSSGNSNFVSIGADFHIIVYFAYSYNSPQEVVASSYRASVNLY